MANPLNSAFRGSGLAVLVALQFFHGADWQKGVLASVPFLGMLLSPLAVSTAGHTRLPVSRMVGIMMCLMAPGLVVAATAQTLTMFMVGIICSVPMLGAVMPLGTAMWQQNAPPSIRGRAFGTVTLVGAVAVVASSLSISFWLGDEPGRYRPILWCFAVMVIAGAVAAWLIPSKPLTLPSSKKRSSGLHVLSLLWTDKLFGYLCIAQMLIGFGNLATIPLRTEFLGSEERGMGYAAGTVFLITVVVPEVFRLFALPIWGRLFDRLNFAVMRMSVSSFFVISLVLTFIDSLPLQVAGAAFFGAAMGGGNIAWTLWVTKLAPAERTADYMAVHTFLTGARGIAGPQVAFMALSYFTIQTVGIIAAGIVLSSIIMLVFVIPTFQGRKHT